MPVLVKQGRAVIAAAVKTRPIHLALGTGKPEWDDAPPELDTAIESLETEVGRRLLKRSQFVAPDDNGDVVVATGVNDDGETEYQRYMISDEPTPYLHVEFQLDFSDGADHSIREAAVFVDTEINDDVPPGQRYLLPKQLKNKGRMLLADRFKVQNMSGDIRETFEYVITF